MTKINFDSIAFNKETKKGDFIIGLKGIEKAVKKKEITKIYISKDILKELLVELEKISKENKISLINTDLNKEQLREICKKPFLISAVGVKTSADSLKDTTSEEDEEIVEKKEKKISQKKSSEKEITEKKEKKEIVKKDKKEKNSGKK